MVRELMPSRVFPIQSTAPESNACVMPTLTSAPFIEHVAGATGFFEWESEPQTVAP